MNLDFRITFQFAVGKMTLNQFHSNFSKKESNVNQKSEHLKFIKIVLSSC